MRLLFFLCMLFGSTVTGATLTATCSPPVGTSVLFGVDPAEYLEGNTKKHPPKFVEDGFANVQPAYIMESIDSAKISILWKTESSEPDAATIPLVLRTKELIIGIEKRVSGIWTHSLYPRLGVSVVTRSVHSAVPSGSAGLFVSECEFKGDW